MGYKKKTGYLGNPNLKEIGTQIEFTKEQVEEYIKCSNDPVYFIKKYIFRGGIDKNKNIFCILESKIFYLVEIQNF